MLLALLGWLCGRRWPRMGNRLIVASLALLYVFSLPFTASLLSGLAQRHPALDLANPAASDADVIVVLAGGLYRSAPEYGDDSINLLSLGRLRYAAKLARQLGLPVLVSGGVKNTRPAGRYSEAELAKALLVTHALHMPRAVRAFNRAGLEVIAAPTLFFPTELEPWELESWMPSGKALQVIRYVLHEWLGEIWYWLRDG